MYKKSIAIILSVLMLVALVGCGGGSNDGTNEGKVGDTMRTELFNFTVDSAAAVDSYAGYSPEAGNKLVDVVITTTNTAGSTLEMYETDYQLQWGERNTDDDNFANTFDPIDDTMAPFAYDLTDGESMTFHYLYEVPESISEFDLCYLEELVNSDGEEIIGDIHFVTFSI